MLKRLHATPKVVRYLISGVAATAVDYLVYEVLALTILGTDLLWLASIISGIVSTFAAFFLHSHLTWIDRDPGKFGVVKFFIWNIAVMITLRPAVIALFSSFTGFFQWVFSIVQWLHLPFSYDFTLSTGTYLLVTLVIMVLNYIFYDKFVFNDKIQPQAKSQKKKSTTIKNEK